MTDQTSVETTPEALESASDGFEVFSSQPEPEPEKPEQNAEAEEATDAAGETDTGDDAPQDTEGGKPKPKGVQKRIDELTANWRGAERDRDYWRDLAMQAQQKPQQQAPQPQNAQQQDRPGKPDPKSFRDGDMDPAYFEALAGWQADQRVAAALEKQRQDMEAETRDEEQRRKQAEFSQKLAEAGEYGEKVKALASDGTAPVSQTMVEVARSSENGVKVLAHLHDDRAELRRIASLPDHMQPYEMARLEQRIIAEQTGRAATKAPDPFPSASGKSAAIPAKDPAKMSQKEYDAWREKEIERRQNSGW